ncbi:hypothetical protein L1049_023384 [Liquidambar formosana]|uniref:DUF4283 domain-containing protein n=1 Tax=Liquidambar formosana TaxID=63359 RepID=A0AAP0X423_LIQFO
MLELVSTIEVGRKAISSCCKGTGNRAGSSKACHLQDKGAQVRKKIRLAFHNGGPVKKDLNERDVSRLMGDWKKAFICARERVADGWDMIQVELANLLECQIFLIPFQLNKVVFFCCNMDKADYFTGKILLRNGVNVFLSRWSPGVNSIRGHRFMFKGGWVSIEGLPFHLWREDVF